MVDFFSEYVSITNSVRFSPKLLLIYVLCSKSQKAYQYLEVILD